MSHHAESTVKSYENPGKVDGEDLKRSMRRDRDGLGKVAKTTIGLAIAAQISAVGAIYLIDHLRKARIPGGSSGFPTIPPEKITVGEDTLTAYTEGASLYHDMLQAIAEAKKTIYFETYVWRSDVWGMKFKDALVAAAERGVEVFIIYDGFGSLSSKPSLKNFPSLPTLHVHSIRPVRVGLFIGDLRRTGRNHRKVLIVDDQVGFLGGFNIGDDFGNEWRDTHIRIEGPAVHLLTLGFYEFWNTFRSKKQPELPDDEVMAWNPLITAAFNLPSHLLFPVRQQYLDAFRRARKSLQIQAAYFIPDDEILVGMIKAARRGVQVKVLIPEYSNHILADWVARPYFGRLLQEGVEIWLYEQAMIHAKTVVVDDYLSIVGTANIDRLSMRGNFEVTMQIDSPAFARQMNVIFDNDLTNAHKLTFEEWQARSRATKVLERLVRAFNFIV